MVTEADIGWTAGIIDGEGSIGVYSFAEKKKGTKAHKLRLSVTNTDIRILYRLKSMWGGNVHHEKRRLRENCRETWVWVRYASKACNVLRGVRSQLTSKGEQADLALEFGQLLGTKGKKVEEENLLQREKIALELRIAKGRKVG